MAQRLRDFFGRNGIGWWIVLFVLVAFLGLALTGCGEPTVTSPISGLPVTAAQLTAEAQAEAERLARDAAQKDDDAKAELEAAQRKAERELSRLDRDNEQAREDVLAVLDSDVAAVVARATRAHRQTETDIAALNTGVSNAVKALEAEAARRAGIFSVVQHGAALIPGAAPWMPLAAGIAAIFGIGAGTVATVQTVRKNKAEKVAEKAEANHVEAVTNAERLVNSVDFLKALEPAVKTAFKTHAAEIKEWQGEKATTFVTDLQTKNVTEIVEAAKP